MASAPPSTPRRRTSRASSGSSRGGKFVPEQYLLLPGKSTWDDYLRLDRRHCSYALRLTYADGQLEFISISEDHERIKRMIGSLRRRRKS